MIDLILDILSWILLMGGSFFALTGAISLIRFPDFFTRVHGAGVIDGLGAGMILVGLLLQAGSFFIAVKIVLILIFMLVTGPTAVHALASSALHGGMELKERPRRDLEKGTSP